MFPSPTPIGGDTRDKIQVGSMSKPVALAERLQALQARVDALDAAASAARGDGSKGALITYAHPEHYHVYLKVTQAAVNKLEDALRAIEN